MNAQTLDQAKLVEAVMSQAQVFASAWALAGSRFDSGNGIELAEQQKDELRVMVAQAVNATPSSFDFVQHLHRQQAFSLRTFGPGVRTTGVCDHISKELVEVQLDAAAGKDTLPEWVDVVILALDGALRSGASPEQITSAIVAKQARNESRRWPDWRACDPNKAIEHDRSDEQQSEGACACTSAAQ